MLALVFVGSRQTEVTVLAYTSHMLTQKQARFIEEFLLDLNATQAAIRAGYSAKTANQQGPRLLENREIADAIDIAKIQRSTQTGVDARFVLRRLVDEVEADLADLFDEKNRLKPIDRWPAIWRRGLVVGVDTEELFEGSGDDRRQIGLVRKLRLSDRGRSP